MGPSLTARDYGEKDSKSQEDLFGLRNVEPIDPQADLLRSASSRKACVDLL